MDSRSKTLAIIVVSALAGLVPVKPWTPRPTAVDMTSVLNKTVCPISVEIDEDPERIPPKIKHLHCASDSVFHHWCMHRQLASHECCHHAHNDALLSCVEVVDTQLVYFPKQDQRQPYRISVGCVCAIEPIGIVSDATPN